MISLQGWADKRVNGVAPLQTLQALCLGGGCAFVRACASSWPRLQGSWQGGSGRFCRGRTQRRVLAQPDLVVLTA